MELRHFIVGEIQRLETMATKVGHQFFCFKAVPHLHPDKNVRLFGVRDTVIEFSHVPRPDQSAKFPEATARFGHRDGE